MPAIFCVALGWALFDLFIVVLFARAGSMRQLRWARRSAGAAIPVGHEAAHRAAVQGEPPSSAQRARAGK